MEKQFRFGIMGAGKIAGKFCEAVRLTENAVVTAVASKSMERAGKLAEREGIPSAYDSYEKMLQEEKPDCVYIAVTTDAHYNLTMLCLDYGVPVLCEKAMFMSSREAREAFDRAGELGVFVMEAMWSRFLPSVNMAREWILSGRIGRVEMADLSIGFCAPKDPADRYMNPALGGGAAFDITVYAYEIMTYLVNQDIRDIRLQVTWGETGIDLSEQIVIQFDHALAALRTSFAANLDEQAVIYGDKGKIVLPHPHYGNECFLYQDGTEEVISYRDERTKNGFVYQIEEVMSCMAEGRLQSAVVPHELTIACARLFDRIMETKEAPAR